MTSRELRERYLKFFGKLGHKIIDPAPLVLEGDPTTLFTSAGMQPLVPYLKGKKHPEGKRLVNSQPCFRSQDIEEVGDSRHTTFFEMLGNWSLGDYFKKEQLEWFWQFLTEELQLDEAKLYVSVFEGGDGVSKDTESESIWKSLGVPDNHIYFYPAKKNWWSLSGAPDQMTSGDVGGPDSEVFYDFGTPHDPKFGAQCHPNCDCGRFLEIGNSVFIQYEKQGDGSLKELAQKNVDFGGGLERLVAATENTPDIFKIDVFAGAKEVLGDVDSKATRVILDHTRAASFMIDSGVIPLNKEQGYILRRLIRRSAIYSKTANINLDSSLPELIQEFKKVYQGIYLLNEKISISGIITGELGKFEETLERGLKEIAKAQNINERAFDLYQTYGFPLELTEELAKQRGLDVDKAKFYAEFEKHKELSRTASAGMFRGGLATMGETETKYHTATHLLQAALRRVLGNHVRQMGSNITSERLRFDFSHPQAMTEEEIRQTEELINRVIDEDLPVTREVMPKDKALAEGALAFFKEKYPDEVSVYSIGPSASSRSSDSGQAGQVFSKELCGGPHVGRTGEIGRVTITKEESAGSGIRRIYAALDK